MSQIVFLSVPKNSRDPIRATLYKCPKTHAAVVANECVVPMSPYSGDVMRRATGKNISVTASDITEDNLKVVGQCRTCEHVLIASDAAISSLARTKPHCVMCGNSVQAMQSQMSPQILKDVIHQYDLGEDENLHDDPMILHGDPKYRDAALNDQLLATEILAAMDDEDNSDEMPEDDNDYSDDDSDEDYDDSDDSGDGEDEDDDYGDLDDEDDEDDDDLGENEYYGDEDEGDEDGNEDEIPNYTENDDEDNMNDDSEVYPSDDDDDTMEATASMFDDNDMQTDDMDDMGDMNYMDSPDHGADMMLTPQTMDAEDVSTQTDDPMAQESAMRQVAINAADALAATLENSDAVLAVLPVDNSTAMILAMVEGVGYMPYLALEASKATEEFKPIFANPTKLINTVNAVLANSTGDIGKDLKRFGVRQITYSVRASALIEKRIREGVNAATAALLDEKNHMVEDLRQCLAIAATQVLKNLSDDAPNVVSAALSESLKQVGVRSASNLVDDAFTNHGPELMKTIIAKALDLMNKPFDVRNEIAKYVTAATSRNVLASPVTTGDRVAKSLAEGSLPLSVQVPAGNTVESADAANVIPITASTSNVNYKDIVKNIAANKRVAR